MAGIPVIVRQYGDDTSITDATKCLMTVAPVNKVSQRSNFAVAVNGSSQYHVRTQNPAGNTTAITLIIRTFGAIYKRGISP